MFLLLYISSFFVQLIEPSDSVELKIEQYSLTADALLTLNCSVVNNTSTVHSVYLGEGWCTIPYVLNLTLFVFDKDTLSLDVAYPYTSYPGCKYGAIEPYSQHDFSVTIYLKELYKIEPKPFDEPHYPLTTGAYFFQLVYYDRLLKKGKAPYKAYLNDKRIRQHTPVSDTLRSNIVYIDLQRLSQTQQK